jgi:hypothetical protein
MIVEKKEQLLARFANFFEDKYYRDLWKSSGIYLRFQYYYVDDVEFAASTCYKNKWKTMFYYR